MKLFLAGTAPFPELVKDKDISYVLESFYYFKEWQYDYIKNCKDFLLDSGAYTFMMNSRTSVRWGDYIERYADFINKNNVEKFFELDIDAVIGYENVLKYRNKLEQLVGRKCVPVWHKERGIDEFRKMCKEYDYIAVGGIVSGEIKPRHYKLFPTLINEAHKYGTKIHGLGFTGLKYLPEYHFDSVDSTSWCSGVRFGSLYHFSNGKMVHYSRKEGKRAIREKINEHNLQEWIKFQKYAEVNL